MAKQNPSGPQQQQKQDKKPQRPKPVQLQQEEQIAEQIQKSDRALLRQAMANPGEASPEAMQAVQRAYGNQFAQRMQRPAAPDGGMGRPGPRPVGNNKPPIQPKLSVNEPGDQYEQEAEAVAETVSRAPEHTPPVGSDGGEGGSGSGGAGGAGDSGSVSGEKGTMAARKNGQKGEGGGLAREARDNGRTAHRAVPTHLRGKAFNIQRTSLPDTQLPAVEEGTAADFLSRAEKEHAPPIGIDGGQPLQRDSLGYDPDGTVDGGIEEQISRKQGEGQPLPDPVRNKMEGHMGSDFSNVRVHNDGESDNLNRSLSARAFTTGNNIFFSRGEYEPGSQSGQKLLAHELTHVVQQGAATPKAQRADTVEEDESVQRAEPEEEIQLSSTEPLLTPPQQIQRETDTAVNTQLAQTDPQMRRPVLRAITPFVARAATTGAPDTVIQREEDEEKKAKEKGKEKVAEGQQKANEGKAEKESDKNKAEQASKEEKETKVGGPKQKPQGDPQPKLNPPKAVESKGKVNTEEMEPPEPAAADTGSLGWPPTKAQSVPDWNDEVAKFDAFKAGDFESLGVDLSGLEGDTTGLDEGITVDDPEIRRQMVADALANGMGGDGNEVGPMQYAGSMILDTIPFAGPIMGVAQFATEGPGAWWETTKSGFTDAAANIKSAWQGMGEGSGWNRAASFIELVIGLLEMINNIAQFLVITLSVVLVVVAIIFAVGTVLAAIPFTSAVGVPMVSFSTPFLKILPMIILALAKYMVIINLIVRVLREIAIAFRIIDMLYFESDPDKLMARQAKLAEHVTGLNSTAKNRITPGIGGKGDGEEKDPNEQIAGAEELEEPLVSDFTIERVNTKSDEDKQDYKTAWMKKYGIRSTADDVRDELMASEIESPPMLEYGKEPEEDVVGRIDRNAIAIIELKRQRLGLAAQSQEAGQSIEVAQNQKEIIGGARQTVADNKDVVGQHQDDIENKLEKQDDLKAETTETEKKGQEGKKQGMQGGLLSTIILKLLTPLMPAVSKAGEKVDKEQEGGVKDGPEKTVDSSDSTIESAKEGSREADERKANTKKTQGEAKESDAKLDDTDQVLEQREEEVDAGVDALVDHQQTLAARQEEIIAEEERLIEERTEALNDAVMWMVEWREKRLELFTEMEERLEERLPKEEKDDDELGGEEKKAAWDIYDEKEDQGKLKGQYMTDRMKGDIYSEESEMAFDVE
jgi:hypothetical protein